MARYLITGGAGFIGSNIAETLVERGEDVVVLDNLSTGHESNMKAFISDITFIEGDVRNAKTVAAALEGVDHVLHQAALASVPRSFEDPVLVNDVNVNGTVTLLEQSRLAGVASFVYAASSSAYGDSQTLPKIETMVPNPLSPYAVSKLTGEYYCSVFATVYGLQTVSLRYFNVFGPRQDPASQYAAVVPIFISKLLRGMRATIYGDGQQSRDFTYITNVVEANLLASRAAGASGQTINIACGESYTVNELYESVRGLLQSDIDPLYDDPRPGDVKHSLADISRARDLLGFSSNTSFETGIKKTVEWYSNRV